MQKKILIGRWNRKIKENIKREIVIFSDIERKSGDLCSAVPTPS